MAKKNGSWTINDTRKIFENDFFRVDEDDVLTPEGKDDKYATIKLAPGIAVLPIDEDGNVYITDQFRYAIGRNNLEAIAGSVEDESKIEGARREALEELGIEAREWEHVGAMTALTAITTASADLFIARGLTFTESETEGSEEIKMIKLPLEDAVNKVLSGEITHGETCTLILKAALSADKKSSGTGPAA